MQGRRCLRWDANEGTQSAKPLYRSQSVSLRVTQQAGRRVARGGGANAAQRNALLESTINVLVFGDHWLEPWWNRNLVQDRQGKVRRYGPLFGGRIVRCFSSCFASPTYCLCNGQGKSTNIENVSRAKRTYGNLTFPLLDGTVS